MNIPTTGNRILPIEEASAILGVSPQTLRNWEKDGRLVSERTAGGHRRYSEETIDRLKKIRMGDNEIIIPNISPSQIMKTMKSFLSGFESDAKVSVIINTNQLDRKVTFTVDSEDGLETRIKTFKMED